MLIKKLTTATLMAATVLSVTANARGKAPAPDMFDNDGIQQTRKAMPRKGMRARRVNVHNDLLQTDKITLNLFDDTIVTAVRDKLVDNVNGHTSWVGHVEGEPDSEVFLTMHGKMMSGVVEMDGKIFEINPKGKNQHEIMQVNPAKNPGHSGTQTADDFLQTGAVPEADTPSTAGSIAPSAQAATTGTVIDLMVAYTAKAKNNASGQAGIEAKITNAVAMANQAYLNSHVDMQLNLVKMVEVNYAESGNMSQSLTDLTGTKDGKMDEIHSLRNQYGADQVSLITADTNYCGIAYMMSSGFTSAAFAPYAFSVVHDDSVYACLSGQTLAHELGHNQGNNHNVEDSGGSSGAYSYSFAHRLCQTNGFRTIMSYACTGGTRISYFSNPNVTLTSGYTTGTSTANNAQSMNNTKALVASFRPTATTTVAVAPKAPGNLAASALSSSQINLAWTDNSTDETGFRLERSTDGVNWVEFAVTAGNVTSFSDTGLAASTTFQYRARSYNGNGNSGYSNVVSAATTTQVVCNSATPTLNMTPGSLLVKGGATVSLSASFTNNDTSACSSTNFTLTNSDGSTIGSYGLSPSGSASASWTFTAPTSDGTFTKIMTLSGANHSNVTASAAITVDATAPTAPALTARMLRRYQVTLNWTASSDTGSGIDHYEVSRNGTVLGNTSSLSFVDKLRNRGSYTYTVKAFDKAGNSAGASKTFSF
ncbi:MAG: hypothetical protein CTY29_07755 [Methylobacter sp.]|nr:MAG: hypothetical protein CTY29_07755 [Methylobacter sp.]